MGQEILYGVGIVILLLALIWGTTQYRRRSRSQAAVADEVTRERYKNNEG
jgi:hypothetical protein